jgi:hypothetical protein
VRKVAGFVSMKQQDSVENDAYLSQMVRGVNGKFDFCEDDEEGVKRLDRSVATAQAKFVESLFRLTVWLG